MIDEKIARKYCKEDLSKIKNYDKAIADTTQTWHCHHMTETWWNCTRKELIENECYYNRKACELIFLTRSEHARLHNKGEKNPMYGRTGNKNPFFGKTHSEETRQKMSEALKGKKHTEESRRKMSESRKGKHHTEATRRKMSESLKGRHSPRKGVTLSEETRRKMSDAAKRRWAKKRGEV